MEMTTEQREVFGEVWSNTHAIWLESFALRFGEAWGFKPRLRKYEDSDHPKGAHLKNGAKSMKGADSISLLADLAAHLMIDVTAAGQYFGRGTTVSKMAQIIEEEYSKR